MQRKYNKLTDELLHEFIKFTVIEAIVDMFRCSWCCIAAGTAYGYRHEAELPALNDVVIITHRVHEGGLGVSHQHKHVGVQAELVYPAVQLCGNICSGATVEEQR